MNNNDDAGYFASRAEEEEEAARLAVAPLAANIHRELAERYRVKASHANGFLELRLIRDRMSPPYGDAGSSRRTPQFEQA